MIYCSGSPLYGTICLKPAPKFNCTVSEGAIVLSVYLIPRDNHISVYRTIIYWAVAKLAHFHFVNVWDDPFPAPTFYRRTLTTVTSHYSHNSTTFLYVVYESNWLENAHKWADYRKMMWWIQIWMSWRWLSKDLATDTWKVCDWQAFLFSYQCTHNGQWGVGKGLVRKLKGALI